jgi:hypothetical protein
MESFSQRKGLKPVKRVMQIDSMDEALRNGLWNCLFNSYLENVATKVVYLQNKRGVKFPITSYHENETFSQLIKSLWSNYFKKPIDNLYQDWNEVYNFLRDYFFKCKWNEVYDFIQFIANNYPFNETNATFMKACNKVLEKEVSAYRFVGGRIVEFTTQEEIIEIERALEIPVNPVKQHIEQALRLLSDRMNPDYRNSIKESISAVESLCKLITKNDKATLGRALEVIERTGKPELHPVLKVAFDKLYGYTSDEDGIRHGMLDEPNLSFEDAKFMLVSCSAFINYLIIKASKGGITI